MNLEKALEELKDPFHSTFIIYHKLLSYRKYYFGNEQEAILFHKLLAEKGKESKIEKEKLSDDFEIYRYHLIVLK
jgi:hypothetical protein